MITKYTLFFLVLSYLCVSAQSRLLQGWDDPNCSQWSSDGMTCLKCSVRAYYDSTEKKCLRVNDLCQTWSETNGKCITCYDGYGDSQKNGKAINGSCPAWNSAPAPFQYDQNCKCYSDDKLCVECYIEYYLGQSGRCQLLPKGCRRVQNSTCVQCLSEYYLNITNQCQLLPANCETADVNGICTQCLFEYVFFQSQNLCVLLPQHCLQVNIDGLCTKCNDGFYLDEDSDCNFLIQGCSATDNQGNCTECIIGYVLDTNNECQILPDHCFFTDTNGICTECQDGYYLDDLKQCQLLPENCLQANQLGFCLQCRPGFQLTSGQCSIGLPSGPNLDCAEQNSKGQCTKCRNFYTLKKGKCIPTGENPFCDPNSCQCGTGKCLKCKDGFFLDNNNICELLGQNCNEFSLQTGQCTSCNIDYVLADGACVPVPVDQNITNINLNCKQQQVDGTCTECRKYYDLVNGDCVPTGKNPKCRLWNKDLTVCYICYYNDLFYLDNNGVCERKNKNCVEINVQNGQCTSCDSERILQDGQCVKQQKQ